MADCVPDSSNAIEADEEVEDEQHSSGSVDEVGRFYFDKEDDDEDLLMRATLFLITFMMLFMMMMMMMMPMVVAVNSPTSTGAARR